MIIILILKLSSSHYLFLFAGYELQLKDQKNGESLTTCTSRSTQTTNNEKEVAKESPDVIASVNNKESKNSTITTKRLSNARIGNGPLSQSDLSL